VARLQISQIKEFYGAPGVTRTRGLLIRSRLKAIFHKPRFSLHLLQDPHGYWTVIGSLIRPRCPLSATISVKFPTLFLQVPHKVKSQSQEPKPYSLGVSPAWFPDDHAYASVWGGLRQMKKFWLEKLTLNLLLLHKDIQ